MTLKTVRVYVDGVEVAQGTIDLEVSAPSIDAENLVSIAPGVLQASGELRCEIDPDRWALLTEHQVFSPETGKP